MQFILQVCFWMMLLDQGLKRPKFMARSNLHLGSWLMENTTVVIYFRTRDHILPISKQVHQFVKNYKSVNYFVIHRIVCSNAGTLQGLGSLQCCFMLVSILMLGSGVLMGEKVPSSYRGTTMGCYLVWGFIFLLL